MTEYKSIIVKEESNGLVTLTLNRPSALNGISDVMNAELVHFLDKLAHPESKARVVILRGAGKAFSAGGDIKNLEKAMLEHSYELWMQQAIGQVIKRMRSVPQPFIAAIHGAAAGAGFSMALACDVRIATRTTKMNAAYILLGLGGAELGSSFHLPRIVGTTVASELLMTGRFIDGERALRVGLVSEIYETEEEVNAAARKLAGEMLRTSVLGLKLTKECMNAAQNLTLDQTLHMEGLQQVLCFKDKQCCEVGLKYASKFTGRQPEPRSKL